MNLPKITKKQQEILTLLYIHRFLNRVQIQALMQHKDYKTINVWLKDLRAKQYTNWHYNKDDFIEKSKPAIYYLDLNGIRHIRSLGKYPDTELRKRYKDATRARSFIDRCLLIASCCITLKERSTNEVSYESATEAEYTNSEYSHNFLAELKPDLFFSKHASTKQGGAKTANYLLELFDDTLPRYMIKKRLKDYMEFIDTHEWQTQTGDSNQPIILLGFGSIKELAYAKWRMRLLLEEVPDELHTLFRFSTFEKIKDQGVNGIIWEEA